MGVVSNVDELVKAHQACRISHGEAVAALMVSVLNGGGRCTGMKQWAEQTSWLFPDYEPSEWTDDRLADTLDALYAASLEPVQGTLISHIVKVLGLLNKT